MTTRKDLHAENEGAFEKAKGEMTSEHAQDALREAEKQKEAAKTAVQDELKKKLD